MEPVHITYRIKLNEQMTEVFNYEMDGKTFELVTKEITNPPAWTELGFKQCSHCPLKAEEHKHCPMALQLHDVVQRFHKTRSIDEVEVEVITEQRRVIKTTALQNAISSMLGLIFPTCGCPKTAYMRPLARFHVPMASEEETVFHVAGMYLLAQYLLNNDGKKGSFVFDGLTNIYNDLHIVNKAVASRLQAVTSSDSVKNAITLIDMYSSLVPILLQDQLSEIRGFFQAYLPEGETVEPTSNYLEQAKAFKLELIPTDEELKRQEAERLAAENKKREEEESEEDEAIKALPEWLRKSMPKDKPPMPRFKPDAKSLSNTELPKTPPEVAKAKPEVTKPAEGLAKLATSEFAMSLSLDPIEEPVVEEKKEEIKVASTLKAVSPAPVKSPAQSGIQSAPEKKKAVFIIPDDLPAKESAESAASTKEEDDGGLKMIDFEP